MEKGTNKEDSDTPNILVITHGYQGNIQMSKSPSMNWHIPTTPKSVYVICIPPIGIKIPICKLQQLSNQIQKRMEHYIEHTQPS